MDSLTIFGLAAVTAILVFYALEHWAKYCDTPKRDTRMVPLSRRMA